MSTMENQSSLYKPDPESFKTMLLSVDKRWCWACGRMSVDRPRGWAGPWLIERAHIVNKPRVEDRRVCVLLCTRCHQRSHGLSGPKISLENMLWLKMKFDPVFYHRAFLGRYCVGNLPRAKKMPAYFVNVYKLRRGTYP